MARNNAINLSMNSFASFDDALDMCELLARETGKKYTVMADNQLGFTAKKVGSNQDVSNSENKEARLKNNDFRQAWRGFIPNYVQILIGILIFLRPYKVVSLVFSLLEIENIPTGFDLKSFGEVLGISGILLILYGLRFIYSYFAAKLYIDDDGLILKKGIIAQTQVQIRFSDIKTIGVHQGILDRLLGIGTLRLDSAGTTGKSGKYGTVDIEFKNMIDPVSIRRSIQRMIDDYIRDHG
ncbi:MAG: PH domain-containing protein [Methylicorpusculum sp.]|uniref:PH domain-containing protein n=1 Tax=Methylicorpusculum sp. TaxID=2713644 RepID=UPI0027290609|nr:PH domain-containing protein [Methylicorpusculum sp.]MDO8938099.1 PH domain-containing protein [Methylicorpusculum sp.]MDP2203244.1 PH domain-containing protein [Methylicorpusculum sp.]